MKKKRYNLIRVRRLPIVAAAITIAAAAAACGGGSKSSTAGTSASASAAPSASAASAPATAAAGLATPIPGTPPTGATPQMASLGDSIFHGQAAGGACFTCHGVDAKGTALAPPLVAPKKWLTGDGTYAFIQQRVTQGMPTPTAPYTAAMPPMGGAQFTPVQIQAVAAYVYSLTHT